MLSSHKKMTIPIRVTTDFSCKSVDYTTLEDDKLLILIGNNRDSSALGELYQRYTLSLGRFLQRGINETVLIEEIYNDVMLTVWLKADSFRGESKVATWLFAIAYRIRISHSRKESRSKYVIDNEPAQEITAEIFSPYAQTIQDAIVDLSEPHLAVIELYYFHGYNLSEIATIVDCPKNTVKTRLFHARHRLKAIIEADQAR